MKPFPCPIYDCKEKLPPFGTYVVGHYKDDNWQDPTDKEGCYWVIVKRTKDTVDGNNELPFVWETFGPDTFFGQDIDKWFILPTSKGVNDEKPSRKSFKV